METRTIMTNFMARAMMTLLVMALTTTSAWADLSGRCGTNLFFNYYSSRQTLEFYIGTNGSTGSMTNFDLDAPWNDVRDNITTVIIGEGVTSIGNYAFYGCTALTDVTIPNTVTDIGNSAFNGCTSLTSLDFPDNLLRIGNAAFIGCELLTPVELPNTVITIEDFAFEKCKALITFTIPDGVKNISRSVFRECTSLTEVNIPDGVTSIDKGAFSYCTALTDISIPNSVTSIGESAFQGCTALTDISIPNSVTSIGKEAFSYCTALTEIYIPNSVTSIGERAFFLCESLTTVYCYAPIPPTLVRDKRELFPFHWNASGRKFYVFNDYVDEYKAAWSDYSGDIIGIPPFSVVLNDNAANISAISESMYLLSNVTLNSRTLYLDGNWNTICLPFNFEIGGSVLDKPGVTLMELDTEAGNYDHPTGFDDGTLYLNFKSAGTTIEAGKPYIIKWTKPNDYDLEPNGFDISNPVFGGVTINSTESTAITSTDGTVSFVGCYSPVTLSEGDRTMLYLGSDNTLYYPSTNVTINSCRAYFQLNDITAGDISSDVNAFVLNFGDDDGASGIIDIDHSPLNIDHSADAWYTIDGRKLSGKPTKKGIYINNGKKIIIK